MMDFVRAIHGFRHWLGSKDLDRHEPEICISFKEPGEFFGAVEIIREEFSPTFLLKPGSLEIVREYGRYICRFHLLGLRIRLQTER